MMASSQQGLHLKSSKIMIYWLAKRSQHYHCQLAEDEYNALSSAMTECIWLQGLLEKNGF